MRKKSKQLRSGQHRNLSQKLGVFMGLASFYRRFVKDFSTLAAPMTEIVKKNVGFSWGKDQENAFNEIKERLSSASLLVCLIFLKLLKLSVMLQVLV